MLLPQVLRTLGVSRLGCGVGAALVALDTTLITQSRFILLDAFLLFFILLATYAALRLRAACAAPFTWSWWAWLLTTGVALGGAVSVKFVGA